MLIFSSDVPDWGHITTLRNIYIYFFFLYFSIITKTHDYITQINLFYNLWNNILHMTNMKTRHSIFWSKENTQTFSLVTLLTSLPTIFWPKMIWYFPTTQYVPLDLIPENETKMQHQPIILSFFFTKLKTTVPLPFNPCCAGKYWQGIEL